MKNYLKIAMISAAFVSACPIVAQEQAAPTPAPAAPAQPAAAQPATPAAAPTQAAPAQAAPEQAQARPTRSANPVSARTTGSGPLANFPPMPKGHVPGISKPEQNYKRDIFTSYGQTEAGFLGGNTSARTVVVINGMRY